MMMLMKSADLRARGGMGSSNGDPRLLFLGLPHATAQSHVFSNPLPKHSQTPKTIAQCLYDPNLTHQNLITSNEKYKAQPRDSNSNLTNPVAAIQLNTEKWWSAFPIDRPAPNIRNTPLSIHDTCYIQLELPKKGWVTRELLWQDLAMIIGHEEQFIQEVH